MERQKSCWVRYHEGFKCWLLKLLTLDPMDSLLSALDTRLSCSLTLIMSLDKPDVALDAYGDFLLFPDNLHHCPTSNGLWTRHLVILETSKKNERNRPENVWVLSLRAQRGRWSHQSADIIYLMSVWEMPGMQLWMFQTSLLVLGKCFAFKRCPQLSLFYLPLWVHEFAVCIDSNVHSLGWTPELEPK